jgi:hypothetical protein
MLSLRLRLLMLVVEIVLQQKASLPMMLLVLALPIGVSAVWPPGGSVVARCVAFGRSRPPVLADDEAHRPVAQQVSEPGSVQPCDVPRRKPLHVPFERGRRERQEVQQQMSVFEHEGVVRHEAVDALLCERPVQSLGQVGSETPPDQVLVPPVHEVTSQDGEGRRSESSPSCQQQ